MSEKLRRLPQLYAASSNAGKLRDFRTAAAVFQMPIEVLPGLESLEAPPEDGATFEENARMKAIAYSAARPGLWVLADDSGLEVDALAGEPGVRSARFADDAGFTSDPGADRQNGAASLNTDTRNNLYLLQRLASLHALQPWTARYRCVLALACDGACRTTAGGSVEGVMVQEPRGAGGFGYDPLFFLAEFGKTMAEIDQQTRQLLSHRGRALRVLLTQMRDGGFDAPR